jgi:hypothetical protein
VAQKPLQVVEAVCAGAVPGHKQADAMPVERIGRFLHSAFESAL